MRGFLIGLVLGLGILPFAIWCWLWFGNPPVAVNDTPFPFERAIASHALHNRVHAQMPAEPDMQASAANLLLGAHIYRANCAACHGLYGRPSEYGPHMYPGAPQLWKPHGHGVVGVIDDPAGATWWKVNNGIRLTGMPSFQHVLNNAQIWQVSVLLANAGKPLPADVMAVLKQPINYGLPVAQTPQSAPGAGTSIPAQSLPGQQTPQ